MVLMTIHTANGKQAVVDGEPIVVNNAHGNGGGNGNRVPRWLTLDRILMVLTLAFVVGGRVTELGSHNQQLETRMVAAQSANLEAHQAMVHTLEQQASAIKAAEDAISAARTERGITGEILRRVEKQIDILVAAEKQREKGEL